MPSIYGLDLPTVQRVSNAVRAVERQGPDSTWQAATTPLPPPGDWFFAQIQSAASGNRYEVACGYFNNTDNNQTVAPEWQTFETQPWQYGAVATNLGEAQLNGHRLPDGTIIAVRWILSPDNQPRLIFDHAPAGVSVQVEKDGGEDGAWLTSAASWTYTIYADDGSTIATDQAVTFARALKCPMTPATHGIWDGATLVDVDEQINWSPPPSGGACVWGYVPGSGYQWIPVSELGSSSYVGD